MPYDQNTQTQLPPDPFAGTPGTPGTAVKELTYDLDKETVDAIVGQTDDDAVVEFLDNLNSLLSEASDTAGAKQIAVRVVITVSP